MAIFPKIQSPCPVRASIGAYMDGEDCRLCKRQVHDMTGWSDDHRKAFLRECGGEVCVSYRLRATVAALAAFAAAAAPMPAAAHDEPVMIDIQVEMDFVVMGGITDPSAAQFVDSETGEDAALAKLPVVFDDEDSDPPAPAAGQS
jgi:predicted Fe-S protein YdhL (DUF1289 family)